MLTFRSTEEIDAWLKTVRAAGLFCVKLQRGAAEVILLWTGGGTMRYDSGRKGAADLVEVEDGADSEESAKVRP